MTPTSTCRRCGERFDRVSRKPPKYCPPCRPIVKRERDQTRLAGMRADLEAKQATMLAILDPMRDYLTDGMIRTAEEYIASLGPDDDGVVPLVTDQPPAGTETNGGPDEGHTTEYVDLAADLEARRVAAIMHDWHSEHPGWWQGE